MSSANPWKIEIDHNVRRQLQRNPKKETERILTAIQDLSANPYAGDTLKMKGEENVWRCRVGSYRVFYEMLQRERIIYVYDAVRRTSTTY